MSQVVTYYLVRHGETEWNNSQRIQGQLDSPLTENGIQEVHQLAKQLASLSFHSIYSSDLGRALQTAEILAATFQLPIQKEVKLRERDFGPYNGKTRQEYEQELAEQIATYRQLSADKQRSYRFVSGMETDAELIIRMRKSLEELYPKHLGQRIILVSHGGMLRNFLESLGKYPKEKLGPGAFKNAGYIVVDFDGKDFLLKEVQGLKN